MDVEQLRQLRRQVERLPNGKARRYPWELRDRVVAAVRSHQREGYSHEELAQELTIPVATLQRWLKSASLVAAQDVLVPVEVIEPATVRTFRVTTPSGFVVDGLELEDVLAVLAALS